MYPSYFIFSCVLPVFIFSLFIRVPYFLSIIFKAQTDPSTFISNAQTDPNRSRQEVSNDCFVAKFGLDTAEEES